MKSAKIFELKTEAKSDAFGGRNCSQEVFWDITATETLLTLSKTESYKNYINSYDSDHDLKVWSIYVPLPHPAFPFRDDPDQEPWEFMKFAKHFIENDSVSALSRLVESAFEASLTIDYFYRRYEGSGMFELTEFNCKLAYGESLDLYFLVATKNDHWSQFEIDFPIPGNEMSAFTSLENLLLLDSYKISDLLDQLKEWDEAQINTLDAIFDGPGGCSSETIDFRKLSEEQLRIYGQMGVSAARRELKQRIGLDEYLDAHELTPQDADYYHLWSMVHPEATQ